VSVKGFPKGTAATNPATQARHEFSSAVFDMALYAGEAHDVDLALGLPDTFPTYLSLAARIKWLRSATPFTIFWVSADGAVRME